MQLEPVETEEEIEETPKTVGEETADPLEAGEEGDPLELTKSSISVSSSIGEPFLSLDEVSLGDALIGLGEGGDEGRCTGDAGGVGERGDP